MVSYLPDLHTLSIRRSQSLHVRHPAAQYPDPDLQGTCLRRYVLRLVTDWYRVRLWWVGSHYSIAERSRAVTMPNFSDAFAFHTRTLPSSEPESTKRASAVNEVASTRCIRFVGTPRGVYRGLLAICVILQRAQRAVEDGCRDRQSATVRAQLFGRSIRRYYILLLT
jgi:hypothetical protein